MSREPMGQLSLVHSLEYAAAVHADRAALRLAGGNMTWGQTRERVARIGGALREAGVRPGDRVAVGLANRPEYLELFYSIAWAGGIVAPLNTRLTESDLRGYMDCIAPRLVVSDSLQVTQAVQQKYPVVAIEGAAPGTGLDDLAAQGPSVGPHLRHEDDIAVLFGTGGTTGIPKAVAHTDRSLVSNAYHTVMELGYDEHTVYLHAAPMFHIADCCSLFAVTLRGGSHAFLERFSPQGFLTVMQQRQVTATLLVPTMISAVLDSDSLARTDLSAWRTLFYGGAPIHPRLLDRALAELSCDLVQGYGMTEISLGAILGARPHHAVRHNGPDFPLARSCGRPATGVRIRISGAEIPGDVGEIEVAGPNVFCGYWDNGVAKDVRQDGWFKTGDLAFQDAEANIYIVDRAKDVIITGGENVYSIEVERAIQALPGVKDAVVIGLPDPYWGERIHALVVPSSPDVTAADMTVQLHGKLAGYKRPRSYDFVQNLPRTPAGKINKAELVHRYSVQEQER
ncbi:class I adenylate-forming enzyme family protein [Planotetraspora thailandica]|uniref:class I adenylate-forming enzyme family protein n=1 Tax=Planotetraspora thailandica TaxID=487172 RepID=UPI00194DCB28|nr:AMP-binding protein [Planotetraspora thailandica]